MLDTLLNVLEGERETVLGLQKVLVSVPALGPDNNGPGERAKADALKAYLADLGFHDIKEYNAPDPRVPCGHRPNLALVLQGQDTTRTLWVISHLDIVPIGDRTLWNTDPFALHVDGDTLFGRGVEDNHQGIVSSVLLAKALKEHNVVPPLNYGMLFVADEETGSRYGLDYLVQQHPDLFGHNDLILVPDAGKPDSSQIEVAEKSILWVKVIVEGKQCHASVPDKGINSLTAAADFITRIGQLRERFNAIKPLFDPPVSTFEPTKKEANVENVNTIPGRDVFYIDCRVLPDYKLDDVIAAIKELGERVAKAHGVKITYDYLQKTQAPPATSVDSPIVKRLIPAIQAVYGGKPRPMGIGGGTVAAFLRSKGLPVVVWATLNEYAHQPNEQSSIRNTLGDAKVMAHVLLKAVAGKPGARGA